MATPTHDTARAGLFANIIAHSFDAIVSKDLSGTVTSWNGAAERIFGWSAEEMIGGSIRSIIPTGLLHEEDGILAQIRTGEIVPRFDTIRLHKDGRQIPVSLSISPLLGADGRIVGASKIARDATEIIQLRDQLAQSERQFRTLANSIPQMAWIADKTGSIFWYNDRWFEYTGTTLDEMRGWGWAAVHHPDHVDRVKARIQESWDTGQPWEDTFPLRSRSGEYRWFLSRAMPVRNADGRVWRWFGTNTDITDRRRYEQQIGILMAEASHRAKNMMGVIQAIVSRTADKQFAQNFGQRLQALSRNQELLTRRDWTGAVISELIVSQLANVHDLIGRQIKIESDFDINLKPSVAEAIGLAIYELTTNATKYGSLSTANGEVAIRITRVERDGVPNLHMSWVERGGPAVSKPKKTGFGSVIIDRNLRTALGAEVAIDFAEEGFSWQVTVPEEAVKLGDLYASAPGSHRQPL